MQLANRLGFCVLVSLAALASLMLRPTRLYGVDESDTLFDANDGGDHETLNENEPTRYTGGEPGGDKDVKVWKSDFGDGTQAAKKPAGGGSWIDRALTQPVSTPDDSSAPAEALTPAPIPAAANAGLVTNHLFNTQSFPARVDFGEGAKSAWDWEELPADLAVPQGGKYEIVAGKCHIGLETGPLQLSSYRKNGAAFAVDQDTTPAQTTFNLPANGVFYAKVSAELIAHITPANLSACKPLLGKRIRLGFYSLDLAKFEGVYRNADKKGRHTVALSRVGEAESQPIYLNWKAGGLKASLEDQNGLSLVLYSPLFALSAPGGEASAFLRASAVVTSARAVPKPAKGLFLGLPAH